GRERVGDGFVDLWRRVNQHEFRAELACRLQHVRKLLIGPCGDARIVFVACGALPDGVPAFGRLLGIEVDHEHLASSRRGYGQMQREGRFSAAPFLADDAPDLHASHRESNAPCASKYLLAQHSAERKGSRSDAPRADRGVRTPGHSSWVRIKVRGQESRPLPTRDDGKGRNIPSCAQPLSYFCRVRQTRVLCARPRIRRKDLLSQSYERFARVE